MKIINSIKKNTILLVTITIIVLYFVLKDNISGIVDIIKQVNIIYIIISFLLFALSVSIKGIVNYIIINDQKKVSKKEAIRENFISQFFNGITPFATGGEPMAVYMLTEQGIGVIKATNYMVQSFIFYQIALVICGFIAVGYNFFFHLFPKVKILKHLVLLGFFINIVVVIVLLLSYSKTVTKKLYKFIIKICKILKIKVNEEELENKFNEYHNSLQDIKKRKFLMTKGILLNIISLSILYLIPYFIIKGMPELNNMKLIDTFVSSAYVYLIGAFVPIPGATGGIEYGFTQFYGNFLKVEQASALLLIWRFLTYYMGIIIGAVIFNIRERMKK